MSLTKTQEKQIDYLNRMEPHEELGTGYEYLVSCHTCEEYKTFCGADASKSFINRHTGHKTWVKYV